MNDTRPFTGRHMLAIMVAFFAVVIGVNLTMAWFATGTWAGLIVKNSYVASQQWNREQEAVRALPGYRWSAAVDMTGGVVAVTLADEAGSPLDGLAVSVKLSRATHENDDRVLALEPLGGGVYRAVEPVGLGLWEVGVRAGPTATAETADESYRQVFRVVARAGS